jgi:hypothetical protein
LNSNSAATVASKDRRLLPGRTAETPTCASSTEAMMQEVAPEKTAPSGASGRQRLTKENVLAALERNKWRLDPTASDLGLSSRYALARLDGEAGGREAREVAGVARAGTNGGDSRSS